MLLTAGNEPKLAELFAHAELKRGGCTPVVPSGPLGGLGDVGGKPRSARQVMIAPPAKMLVFMQLFLSATALF
jgi:hypothetical protein